MLHRTIFPCIQLFNVSHWKDGEASYLIRCRIFDTTVAQKCTRFGPQLNPDSDSPTWFWFDSDSLTWFWFSNLILILILILQLDFDFHSNSPIWFWFSNLILILILILELDSDFDSDSLIRFLLSTMHDSDSLTLIRLVTVLQGKLWGIVI